MLWFSTWVVGSQVYSIVHELINRYKRGSGCIPQKLGRKGRKRSKRKEGKEKEKKADIFKSACL